MCDALILEADDPGQRRRLEMVSDEVGHLAKTLRGAVDGSQELLANRETGGARVTLVQPADCRAPIADAANPPDG